MRNLCAGQTRVAVVMSAASQVALAARTQWVTISSARQAIFAAEMLVLQQTANVARIQTLATNFRF